MHGYVVGIEIGVKKPKKTRKSTSIHSWIAHLFSRKAILAFASIESTKFSVAQRSPMLRSKGRRFPLASGFGLRL